MIKFRKTNSVWINLLMRNFNTSAAPSFFLALILTGWINIRHEQLNGNIVDLNIDLQYIIPLLAVYLSRKYGVKTLWFWWPLVIIPRFSLDIWEYGREYAYVGFGTSLIPLLLSFCVGIASDPRIQPLHFDNFVRPKCKWLVQLSIILLVVAGLESHSKQIGSLRIYILTIPSIALFILSIRWKMLLQHLNNPMRRDQRTEWTWFLSILIIVIIFGRIIFSYRYNFNAWDLSIPSTNIGDVIPLICFSLVMLGNEKLRIIVVLLGAGLILDRVLYFLQFRYISEEYLMLDINMILKAIAAAIVANMLLSIFKYSNLTTKNIYRRAVILYLIPFAVMLGESVFSYNVIGAHGAEIWIFSSIGFIAGFYWRGWALLLVPMLLNCLYLLFFFVYHEVPRIDIATFPFVFAFCGALVRMNKNLASEGMQGFGEKISLTNSIVKVVNLSSLIDVVERVDRSSTWRSFLVSGAPFVVIWQIIVICITYIHIQPFQINFISVQTVAWWHLVIGTILVLSPLAFVITDWCDRQDSLTILKAVTGCSVGAVSVIAVSNMIVFIISELLGSEHSDGFYLEEISDKYIVIISLLFLCGSGLLLAKRMILFVTFFMSAMGILTSIFLLVLFGEVIFQYKEDVQTIFVIIALLGGCTLLSVLVVRFLRLRLILAGSQPRELIFGKIGNKGFWGRMAAAAGLPSTLWKIEGFKQPSFWALASARLIVYSGFVLYKSWMLIGVMAVALGHFVFHLGKMLAAREIWRPLPSEIQNGHILFLRGFDDDQCNFRRPQWNLYARWLDLWSFRRNLDEAMVDEIAQFSPVIALGKPTDKRAPFGALRHYSDDESWQRILTETALSASTIIIVASDSAGVQWEYDLIAQKQLFGKVLLLFRPEDTFTESNLSALEWFCKGAESLTTQLISKHHFLIGISFTDVGPLLMTSDKINSAAYILALRYYFNSVKTV